MAATQNLMLTSTVTKLGPPSTMDSSFVDDCLRRLGERRLVAIKCDICHKPYQDGRKSEADFCVCFHGGDSSDALSASSDSASSSDVSDSSNGYDSEVDCIDSGDSSSLSSGREHQSESDSETSKNDEKGRRKSKAEGTIKAMSGRRQRRTKREEKEGKMKDQKSMLIEFESACKTLTACASDLKLMLNNGRAKNGKKGSEQNEDSQKEDSQEEDSEKEKSQKKGKTGMKGKKCEENEKDIGEKRGKKIKFLRADEIWNTTTYQYDVVPTRAASEGSDLSKYAFTVLRCFNDAHVFERVVVNIHSKPLRICLRHILQRCQSSCLNEAEPNINPQDLFLYLEEICSYITRLESLVKFYKTETRGKGTKDGKGTIAGRGKGKGKAPSRGRDYGALQTLRGLSSRLSHLQLLRSYLEEDFARTQASLRPMLKKGLITFDLLWTIMKADEIAFASTYNESSIPRAFRIEQCSKEQCPLKGQWLGITGKYFDYDGVNFGMGEIQTEIPAFRGVKKIASLPCFPLKYHPHKERIVQFLISRGQKFVSLAGMHYKFAEGWAFVKRCNFGVMRRHVRGRVMVDPANFRRINANYDLSEFSQTRDDDDCEVDEHASPSQRISGDEAGGGAQLEGESVISQSRKITARELLTASPVVLAFAFREKAWLELTVSSISEIEFDDKAFEQLVLPEPQKRIIQALVRSHAAEQKADEEAVASGRRGDGGLNICDLVEGKAKSLVFLAEGPPGVGKTLSAESIADLQRRPLYSVTAGELGTSPRDLEAALAQILDVAHAWGAVLLLDEADVFLEARTPHDLKRNALVSVFLRTLETYKGILFLTTNRVATFDDAFQSRIHIALRYNALDYEARSKVWNIFLSRVTALRPLPLEGKSFEGRSPNSGPSFGTAEIAELAKRDLNGRQIKNAVRSAQALALDEGEPLSMNHLKEILDLSATFALNLRASRDEMERGQQKVLDEF